jgi:hypothetical protein
MSSVDFSGLDGLDRRFADVLRARPGLRRQLHVEAGGALLSVVRSEIGASGLNDSGGKVRGWQEMYVGSGGGYAAVRPVAGGGRGRNPGAITNYLESGHKVRGSSGHAKRRRKSRAKQARVRGFHFYRQSRIQAQAAAVGAANRYAEAIAGRLGD